MLLLILRLFFLILEFNYDDCPPEVIYIYIYILNYSAKTDHARPRVIYCKEICVETKK